MKTKFTLALAAFLAIATTQSFAQYGSGSGSGLATATITSSVTVTKNADLTFGSTAAGTPVSILPTDAAAANFSVSGTADSEVNATFTLPTGGLQLTTDNSITLPVSFGASDASWALDGTNQATATTYDPSTTLTQALSGTGELHIWLGGTVSPAASQRPGDYQGDITLDVAYTGN